MHGNTKLKFDQIYVTAILKKLTASRQLSNSLDLKETEFTVTDLKKAHPLSLP